MLAFCFIWVKFPPLRIAQLIAYDYLGGVATMLFLVWCRQPPKIAPHSIVALLATAPMRALGAISYSLYVTHILVVWLVYLVMVRLGLDRHSPLLMLTLVGVPASVLLAYLFYLIFELPFMRLRKRTPPLSVVEEPKLSYRP